MHTELGEVFEVFPRIENPDKNAAQKVFFGGNQAWFSRHTAQMSGCGPVVAANCFAALAATRRPLAEKCGLRYNENGVIPYAVWMSYQDRVYDTVGTLQVPWLAKRVDHQHSLARGMKASENPALREKGAALEKSLLAHLPGSFGNTIWTWRHGVDRYAKSLRETVRHFTKPTFLAAEGDALLFIREGLAKGSPVVLLTSLNRHELHTYGETPAGNPSISKNKEPHFMAITAVRESPKTGETELVISNYGKVAGIPLANLCRTWQTPLAAASVLTYFVPG